MGQREVLDRLVRARADGELLVLSDPRWSPHVADAAAAGLGRARAEGRVGPGTVVAFSSGSTGVPKGIVRTHASWELALPDLTRITGIGADDVVGLPGPLSSTLFAYGAWHAASVGAAVALADEPQDDATVVHCVPTQLREALAEREHGGRRRLRLAIVAGDRLDTPTLERARRAGVRVVEYYGAAELSFVALAEGGEPLRPYPGVACELRDGVLWSRSAFVMSGYLDPARPGSLRRDGEWCSVGDLAERVGDGFVVRGRGDLAVTTGGHTVVVEEVERELRQVPGVRDVAAVGLPHARLGEQLVAAVAAADDGVLGAVRARVREWPAPSRPRRFVVLPMLPRLASGKLDRAAVRALFDERRR